MKCPRCTTSFHENWERQQITTLGSRVWWAVWLVCPECEELLVELRTTLFGESDMAYTSRALVWPRFATRPVPSEVEERYGSPFRQAAAVIGISPEASAALSRRTLQDILREKAKVNPSNLDREIQTVIDDGSTPSWLAENLDAVRVVGNFAAHPIKGTNTGEVVDVEPGEAEFLLDVLEGAFDFWFVAPAKATKHRASVNAKLKEAGKPALKKPSA
jgi:Domain of unknown function (DUF4145)